MLPITRAVGSNKKAKNALFRLACATFLGSCLLMAALSLLDSTTRAVTSTLPALPAQPGDVVVNEVAWMGTRANVWDEWIELYNTSGHSVTLTGWTIGFEDGLPATIWISGVVAAHGYFFLERAEDATDVPADQVYVGEMMSNLGEQMILRDDHGTIIDAANGDGAEWPAGSSTPDYSSMERIDPVEADSDENWATNDGVTRNGQDALGNPINGTPRARNSAYAPPLVPVADLAISKTGPVTAALGDVLTYTIRLSNTGSVTAAAVQITDVLPAEALFRNQTSTFFFEREGNLLRWTVGEIPSHTPPLLITVSAGLSWTSPTVIRNVVTVTTQSTETIKGNNTATWDTAVVDVEGQAAVRITALLYDGYQMGDADEAVQLSNLGTATADLAGWKICDARSGGSCATIVSGTLKPDEAAWMAYWATGFYTSSGFHPAYAAKGVVSGVLALSGSWPGYANDGDEAVLLSVHGDLVDTLVFEEGNTRTPGWSGVAVESWSGSGGFRLEGQILYRRLDESTGLPVPDTDTAADWAQNGADPTSGRRVRYPGWDLETFFFPAKATEYAHLTVGVAPDNAAGVVLGAIASAQSQIEIAVYSLDHPTVIQRLVAKASTGVSVTVLLEGDPVGLAKDDARWYQQMWACQQLHATGHGACWFMITEDQANIFDRYRSMHAKYMLIDRQQVLLGSQNFTASGLPDDDLSNGTDGSRGVVVLTDAPTVVNRLAELFDHDLDPSHHADLLAWSPTDPDYGSPPPGFTPILSITDYSTYTVVFSQPLTLAGVFEFELLTAPEAALRHTDGLLGLLSRVDEGDELYVEALDERAHWGQDPVSDPNPRTDAYVAAAGRGAAVRILLNGGRFGIDYYEDEDNPVTVAYLNLVARQERLNLRAAIGDPTQFGIHNKMVLAWLDGQGGYVHLGSLNGSESSSKVNREVALQIRSDEVYAYLQKLFEWDWHLSQPHYFPLVMKDPRSAQPPAAHPVVSEVLYDPVGADEGSEWVEIYNPTPVSVDLSAWYLGDVGPAGEFGSGLYTFPPDTVLPPARAMVIARQATAVPGFSPDLEFLIDPQSDDPQVPNMVPVGDWVGFGFALSNEGDEVILLDASALPADVLVYGLGYYPGTVAHPGVSRYDHSLERSPAMYDTDDCSQDFVDRYPPTPGTPAFR